MSVVDFALPDLGEGLQEATLLQWHVKVGDEIARNQTMAEVETAKATLEIPAPTAGVVKEVLVGEGETVEVGAIILRIESSKSGGAEPAPSETQADNGQQLIGHPRNNSAKLTRRRGRGPHAPAAPAAGERGAANAIASPLVRRLARDLDVDLSTLSGSGPGGAITRADVQRAAQVDAPQRAAQVDAPQRAAEVDAPQRAGKVDTPSVQASAQREGARGVQADSIRREIARRLTQSAREIPQATLFTSVDVEQTLRTIRRLREYHGRRITLLSLVARSVCVGLAAHPRLNASWDDEAGEIVLHEGVHLGIATETERGLTVPKVAHAERFSLVELAEAIDTAVDRARSGAAAPSELTGTTFTISNAGGLADVETGTAILNPPEGALLGMGHVQRRPWVVDEHVVPRDVLSLALTIDHRLIDGVAAGRYLEDVAKGLADPAVLL